VHTRIGLQIVAAVGLVTALGIALLATVTLRTHQLEMIDQLTRSTDLLSEAVKRSTEDYMLENARDRLARQIEPKKAVAEDVAPLLAVPELFTPAVLAVIMLFLPKGEEKLLRWVAFVGSCCLWFSRWWPGCGTTPGRQAFSSSNKHAGTR
jgi:hypothetical protein